MNNINLVERKIFMLDSLADQTVGVMINFLYWRAETVLLEIVSANAIGVKINIVDEINS